MQKLICGGISSIVTHCREVANTLSLQAENWKKSVLDRYKVKRRSVHEYEAAARLWSKGLAWEDALTIVRQAFDAVLVEE